ncbi:putative phage tail protein [Clostridium sp. CF012]|uniref:putative phage tail protein n=1 Tax=Clostridium sp. CF012 TaxID=2843319 RepID=UPI001C0CDBB4|nr:putative phage tail protein [Clostridium sp. CF012]MBU3145032.1 YmfQ family protein [Clostridium sp. CF012]
MLYKDNLINNMHKVYREDLWLQEIFKSGGISLTDIKNDMRKLDDSYWFDTIPLEFLPIYETVLKIKTNPLNKIEDRRSFIEAKWKSNGKCDLKLIQAVCTSWKNGSVEVSFIDGKIQLKFNGAYGILDLCQYLRHKKLNFLCGCPS